MTKVFTVMTPRRMRWKGTEHGTDEECIHRIFVGNPQGMRQQRRSEHRYNNNIKISLITMHEYVG